MSERERTGPDAAKTGHDPQEERLQALYAAAYPPLDSHVKASEALRRRVAAVTAGQESPARTHTGERPARRVVLGRTAASLGAALALGAAGLMLVRWNSTPERPTPSAIARAPGSNGGEPLPRPPAQPPGPTRQGRKATSQLAAVAAGRTTARHLMPVPAQSADKKLPGDAAPARDPRPATPAVDDLLYLNGDTAAANRQWVAVAPEAWSAIEARVRRTVRVRDEFVQIPFPRLASTSDRQVAAAVESYRRETAVVDARLSREVTLQQKATALSDLCDRLRRDTGIELKAGPSVADEKVTVFCKAMPLRDVMRQLSRPFGYTWLRSGKEGAYEYELVQDLRSQLVVEELRNQDRHAALLALGREAERYRPYLHLSPDEARERIRSAPAADRPLLEKLAGWGWGPVQLYFRLSPQEMAALRAGQTLTFSEEPGPGDLPLPPEVARGVLESFRDWRVVRRPDGFEFGPQALLGPGGVPATAVPEARARVTLMAEQSELGHFTLGGLSGVFTSGDRAKNISSRAGQAPYAVGQSPSTSAPENAKANAKLRSDPALAPRVTVRPVPSCPPAPAAGTGEEKPREPKVTSADVLEALHRATGLPVVADYYTRLYPLSHVSAGSAAPLFDTLNRLADTLRLRWSKEGAWLQFRSSSFYHDSLKEVPNRLLARWTASRRQHGALTLDDMVEIAQLSDAQLDAAEMAEGARECFGLREWDLARSAGARPHLRFLASFTPAQRGEALSSAGLPFTRMSLAQQQQFIALAMPRDAAPLRSLEELAGATLRVEYTHPGGFQWGDPQLFHNWVMWVVPVEPGPRGRRVLRPSVRAGTREAALQAVRALDPRIRDGAVQSLRDLPGTPDAANSVPLEAQVFPTELRLLFVYIPGTANARSIRISSGGVTNWQASW